MAASRVISTNFWKDRYIADLDPTEKLLFLYFLTNPQTSIAGVYEMTIREVAFDTGIDKDMIEKILKRFCDDEKMWYQDGWLVLRNFTRHQRMNPSVQQGIQRVVNNLPLWLQEKLLTLQSKGQLSLGFNPTNEANTTQSGDSLATNSPQLGLPNLTKPNLTKPNLTKPKPAALGRSKIDQELAAKESRARRRPSGGTAPLTDVLASMAETAFPTTKGVGHGNGKLH